MREWQDLTVLTQGRSISVSEVLLRDADGEIRIRGDFELPKLAQLSGEDQVFVMAFLQSQGSIKDMEKLFGVSYPTIKSRLARINQRLGLVEVESSTGLNRSEVLELLERGEITADEAINKLKG